MLKNPAYLHFYVIAGIVALIWAAFGFKEFHIRKLDLEPKISLDISLKLNFMQRNIVHKLFIIMVDLTCHTHTYIDMVSHPFIRSCRNNPQFSIKRN